LSRIFVAWRVLLMLLVFLFEYREFLTVS